VTGVSFREGTSPLAPQPRRGGNGTAARLISLSGKRLGRTLPETGVRMGYQSPWISQLRKVRSVKTLDRDTGTGVAIVGGGIAGISTAYHLLQETGEDVALLEADRIAHGATGHNAGQAVSYFERPFTGLVAEFGLEMAAAGQRAILSAWDILDGMFLTSGLTIPFWRFTGYAGFTEREQIKRRLESVALMDAAGLPTETVLVSRESGILSWIPEPLRRFCTEVPRVRIQDLLETRDASYCAAVGAKKGCLNSALFCEELAGYLLTEYRDRFYLAEISPVNRITVERDHLMLQVGPYSVQAKKVVLCTNGFTGYLVTDPSGQVRMDPRELVRGIVGAMAGYSQKKDSGPAAIRYYPTGTLHHSEPYYYLTRRPFGIGEEHISLVSVGGPEVPLPPGTPYHRHHSYLPGARGELDRFLSATFREDLEDLQSRYTWHGLMGYTPGDVRIISPDPDIPNLLYNLGCNGVGILPSIYGGKRIADLMNGVPMGPSLFDHPKIRGRKGA
jgi:glycine/D-amino acid oxidase-like deaminating enzyme